jgi:hypothetical protein
MKRQHIFLFPLVLLISVPLNFPNPGDKQTEPTIKILRGNNQTAEITRKSSLHVLPPSPRELFTQESNEFDAINDEDSIVAAPQKTLTGEQLHKCLLALKTFCKETGAKEEGLKVETTLAAFQPK